MDAEWPPEGYHLEWGVCPNAGHACNCIGACQPRLIKDDEEIGSWENEGGYFIRTDEV